MARKLTTSARIIDQRGPYVLYDSLVKRAEAIFNLGLTEDQWSAEQKQIIELYRGTRWYCTDEEDGSYGDSSQYGKIYLQGRPYGGGSTKTKEAITVNIPNGVYKEGDVIDAKTDILEIVTKLLSKEKQRYPVFFSAATGLTFSESVSSGKINTTTVPGEILGETKRLISAITWGDTENEVSATTAKAIGTIQFKITKGTTVVKDWTSLSDSSYPTATQAGTYHIEFKSVGVDTGNTAIYNLMTEDSRYKNGFDVTIERKSVSSPSLTQSVTFSDSVSSYSPVISYFWVTDGSPKYTLSGAGSLEDLKYRLYDENNTFCKVNGSNITKCEVDFTVGRLGITPDNYVYVGSTQKALTEQYWAFNVTSENVSSASKKSGITYTGEKFVYKCVTAGYYVGTSGTRSENVGTNASVTGVGTYEFTLILDDNHKWSDKSGEDATSNRTYLVYVFKKPVSAITTPSDETYTGTGKTWNSGNNRKFSSFKWSKAENPDASTDIAAPGTSFSKTESGIYTVTYDLTDSSNYRWEGDSLENVNNTGSKTVNFTIQEATVTVPGTQTWTFNNTIQTFTAPTYTTFVDTENKESYGDDVTTRHYKYVSDNRTVTLSLNNPEGYRNIHWNNGSYDNKDIVISVSPCTIQDSWYTTTIKSWEYGVAPGFTVTSVNAVLTDNSEELEYKKFYKIHNSPNGTTANTTHSDPVSASEAVAAGWTEVTGSTVDAVKTEGLGASKNDVDFLITIESNLEDLKNFENYHRVLSYSSTQISQSEIFTISGSGVSSATQHIGMPIVTFNVLDTDSSKNGISNGCAVSTSVSPTTGASVTLGSKTADNKYPITVDASKRGTYTITATKASADKPWWASQSRNFTLTAKATIFYGLFEGEKEWESNGTSVSSMTEEQFQNEVSTRYNNGKASTKEITTSGSVTLFDSTSSSGVTGLWIAIPKNYFNSSTSGEFSSGLYSYNNDSKQSDASAFIDNKFDVGKFTVLYYVAASFANHTIKINTKVI